MIYQNEDILSDSNSGNQSDNKCLFISFDLHWIIIGESERFLILRLHGVGREALAEFPFEVIRDFARRVPDAHLTQARTANQSVFS